MLNVRREIEGEDLSVSLFCCVVTGFWGRENDHLTLDVFFEENESNANSVVGNE